MQVMGYSEPELTYLVLDFQKEAEIRQCLLSIKEHTTFPYKVIYLHNGAGPTYPRQLFDEGLIDQCIQTKVNNGLGIGTRDLFAASFSSYSFYLQNDQYLNRDFTQEEFDAIKKIIGNQYQSPEDGSAWTAMSVDVSGGMWGLHNYTERGHIIPTSFYKKMESADILGYHGAGPWHEGPWREEQIQKFYKAQKFLHYTYEKPFVTDNGYRAVRQNKDGSRWEHKTDTKELRLLSGPVKERDTYPNLTDEEWASVLTTQLWPEWQVPEQEKRHVFHQWN